MYKLKHFNKKIGTKRDKNLYLDKKLILKKIYKNELSSYKKKSKMFKFLSHTKKLKKSKKSTKFKNKFDVFPLKKFRKTTLLENNNNIIENTNEIINLDEENLLTNRKIKHIKESKEENFFYCFCNKLVNRGLKNSAYTRFLSLLERLKLSLRKNNQDSFLKIFQFLEIYIHIYKKKIGANIHQIPLFIKKEFRLRKGLSIFFKVIESKKERKLEDKLFKELLDILSMKGTTVLTRDNLYTTAIEEKSNLRFIKPRHKKTPDSIKRI